MFFINFSSGERWEKAGNLPVEMEFCRVNGTIPNDPFSDRPLRHPIFPYLMVFCKEEESVNVAPQRRRFIPGSVTLAKDFLTVSLSFNFFLWKHI